MYSIREKFKFTSISYNKVIKIDQVKKLIVEYNILNFSRVLLKKFFILIDSHQNQFIFL